MGLGSAIGTGLANGIKAGVNTLIGLVESAINTIIRAWNRLEFKMPSVNTHIPGVGTVGGFTIGTPNAPLISLPRLDKGGTVLKTGLAVVDRGETFSGVGRATTAPNITINITGTWDLTNPNHIERLTSALTTQIRRNLAMGA